MAKTSENNAKDVETKQRRKELAAELGELTLKRAKLVQVLNEISSRCNGIATAMEKLDNGKRD